MVPNEIDKQMHCDIKVKLSLQFVLILDFVIIVSSSSFGFL
jgi:hypothetical protein